MTAKLSWSCEPTSVWSAPVRSERPVPPLGQQHHLIVRRPSVPSHPSASAQPVGTASLPPRSLRPILQLATPPLSLSCRAIEAPLTSKRADQAARAPLNTLARRPSPSKSPPSPASSPSETSTASPTLYRRLQAHLSPSPTAANVSGSNASRSPSPTLTRSKPKSPLLEVHGDSFCGVFTLIGPECVVRRYSGASARVSFSSALSSFVLYNSTDPLDGSGVRRDSTIRSRRDRSL